MPTRLPFTSRTFLPPTSVTLEASPEVIFDLDLDTFGGEQYDTIDNVISLEVDSVAGTISLTTVRSLEAYRRGEPNAGRGTHTFPRSAVEAIWL